MKREKKKKDKRNYGVAFLIVNSKIVAEDLIANFKDLKREIKLEDPNFYKNFEVYVRIYLI